MIRDVHRLITQRHWQERRVHGANSLRTDKRRKDLSIFRTRALRRVAAVTEDVMTLHVLQNSISRLRDGLPRNPEELRRLADQNRVVKEEVAIAARILRQHAETSRRRFFLLNIASEAEAHRRADQILDIANEIESFYQFSHMPRAAWLVPSKLLGQKGDARAFAVRAIAQVVPKKTRERFAAIAELIVDAGFPGTTPQLVRSILLNGRT